MITEKSFFSYGYISKDRVLQVLLQYLFCSQNMTVADLLTYHETEEEIINSGDWCGGCNKYFNSLPLKYQIYLVINFIKGISNPGIIHDGLDYNLYLTVDHLFGDIYREIECEFDCDREEEESFYNYRECLSKCLSIVDNPKDEPEKSILVFDKSYFNELPEECKTFNEYTHEIWEEYVEHMQGRLFGGFLQGEFSEYQEYVNKSVEEQKLLFQLCSQYSLLELVEQYKDIVWEYGNIELSEIKNMSL